MVNFQYKNGSIRRVTPTQARILTKANIGQVIGEAIPHGKVVKNPEPKQKRAYKRRDLQAEGTTDKPKRAYVRRDLQAEE
jgi:hypothetical protein